MFGKSSIKKYAIELLNYFSSYKLSDGSLVNVQIMDTAGQERFKSINASYCRKADCCLLVYDISNKNSFEECKYYSEQIREKCKKGINTILLGNKTDLEHKRQISPEEGANFALKNNYLFLETSCIKNEKVADAFQTLIEITNKSVIENNDNKLNLNIKDNNNKKDKRKRCLK